MTLPLKIKKILLEPDPRLRAQNVYVTETWSELEYWTKQMFKAMYRTENGVGLAAPQVGWNVRLFVMDAARFKELQPRRLVFWNPRILEYRGDIELKREGCLSLPRVFGDLWRYPEVRLEAQGPAGPVDEYFKGIAAEIIQHEVDHLNGILCRELWKPVGTEKEKVHGA